MKVQSLFSMPNFQPTAALFSSALFTVPLKISQWQLWQRMFYISQGYILFLTWKRTENSKARQNLTHWRCKILLFLQHLFVIFKKKLWIHYIALFTCSIRCTFSKIKKKHDWPVLLHFQARSWILYRKTDKGITLTTYPNLQLEKKSKC